MKILSIETSCDETAISLIKADGDKTAPRFEILGNVLYSQADKHKEFGGVFPSLAKREHAKNLIPLLQKLLKEVGEEILIEENTSNEIPAEETVEEKTDEKKYVEENLNKYHAEISEILKREPDLTEKFSEYISTIKKPEVDLIAVTSGPGLEPALWVGINFAKALSLAWQIPVIPVNHMEGHITSVLLNSTDTKKEHSEDVGGQARARADKISFPAIALLISGGHTELVLVNNWGKYELIGKTKDDAVGEAYDKVARLLDLEYPGGPKISALADVAREKVSADKIDFETETKKYEISLPRPMITTDDFDFSFSGIKTAVLYLVKKLKEKHGETLTEEIKSLVALEFENAVTEVLYKKTTKALDKHNAKTLIIGGGVIANKNIRKTFQDLQNGSETLNSKNLNSEISDSKILTDGLNVFIPEINLTTDNAIMIAIAGYLKSFEHKAEINPEIVADGNLDL